jgi:hypothetical protein
MIGTILQIFIQNNYWGSKHLEFIQAPWFLGTSKHVEKLMNYERYMHTLQQMAKTLQLLFQAIWTASDFLQRKHQLLTPFSHSLLGNLEIHVHHYPPGCFLIDTVTSCKSLKSCFRGQL